MGFGPTTSTLARLRSTPELYPHRLTKVFIAVFFIMQENFHAFGIFLITFVLSQIKIILNIKYIFIP